ncbi:MAG: EamA family transporter, partial [Phototrophicaceae bacterium]
AWACSLFFVLRPTQELGAIRALFYTELSLLIPLSLMPLIDPNILTFIDPRYQSVWMMNLYAGLIVAVANLLLYKALEIGVFAIVTPISSTYAAYSVLIEWLRGNTLTGVQYLGIAVTLAGVALASIPPKPEHEHAVTRQQAVSAALLAFVSAIAYGVGYWMTGEYVASTLPTVTISWVGRITTLLVGVLYLVITRTRIQWVVPSRQTLYSMFWGGVSLGVAWYTTYRGYALGNVAIVSVLSSIYSGITPILGMIFLKERLARYQWLGIVGILMGTPMIIL